MADGEASAWPAPRYNRRMERHPTPSRRRRHRSGLPQSIGGKVFLTLFLLVWMALPVFMLGMLVRQARNTIRARSWVEMPCRYVSADVRGANGEFWMSVRYEYEVDGVRHVGTRHSIGREDFTIDGIAKRNECMERYAKGNAGTCFVNPADHSEAVLERDSLCGAVAGILFALIFPCVGCGILGALWRPRRKTKPDPLSNAAAPPGIPACPDKCPRLTFPDLIPLILGTIFVIVGSAVTIVPVRSHLHDRKVAWETTTGTVLASSVQVSGGKSTTYSPYVAYRYSVDGRTYENDALSPVRMSISDRDAVVRHAARYRPAAEVQVLYDPDDPSHSFLEKPGASGYAIVAMPLMFVLFGVVALAIGVGHLRNLLRPPSADAPLTGLRLKRVFGDDGALYLFTFVWCAFSFTFTAVWFTTSGPFSWTREFWNFDKFFVLVFPLIGVGFIVASAKKAVRRALTGRYTVEIACDRLRPGARVQVAYHFDGDASRLGRVVFAVTQQAIVVRDRRGGGHHMSDANGGEVHSDKVWSVDDQARAQDGTFVFTFPNTVIAGRIIWRLTVKYRGLTDTFRLDVAAE